MTEFGAQGLELDAALVAWGTDFKRVGAQWDSSSAAKYRRTMSEVRDPHQLRLNSYRVLLTRGREATIIFVPPVREMDETAEYLASSGMHTLR